MKIIDSVPFFMDNYQPSIKFLREYYSEYPDIFNEYFTYHCKDTEERHNQSISKYAACFNSLKKVHKNIVPIINEVADEYFDLYNISFPVEVNLIVGGFGSNAYTHHQIIPNISFALEKLSPENSHLKTIVAHEFGHVTHNIISNEAGKDWSRVQWNNPVIWLFQEGAATHFSRRIVPDLHPATYFSFDDNGNEWMLFAESNEQAIKLELARDLANCNPQEIFREWFSINGGKKFGHSRLAYYLGDRFFQHQVSKLGEKETILAWNDPFIEEIIINWLQC